MKILLYPPEELMEHLKAFEPLLSKRQFKHLANYLTGLMASQRKTIRSIAKSCLGGGDQSSLNRFLHSKAWRPEDLNQILLQKALEGLFLKEGSILLLILDDSLLEKFGRCMELVGYLYSPKDRKSILCHDIVTSHLLTEDGEDYPVDLRLYARKEQCRKAGKTFKSRVDLAVELIRAFQPPKGVEVIVLMDAWYFCKHVVDAIRARGWHYISEAKSNRIVYHDGSRNRLDEMPLKLRDMFRDVETGGDLYAAFKVQVEIPKIGLTTLLMKSKLQKKRDPIHFLVSDLLEWSSSQLIETFRKRHKIDEFYREANQNLGLDGYMVRSAYASNRHWRLVFLAYALLVLLRRGIAFLSGKTIGELCEWVHEKCVEGFASWLYRLFKAGASLEEALKGLNQTAKL